MAEAIAPEAAAAKPIEPRRLYPGLAFFAAVFGLGLGYVYVGRIRHALAFAAAPLLLMVAMGWTRMLVDPLGWYLYFPGLALIWLAQLVHPMVLARPQPLAPPKSYNRWWWYVAWIVGIGIVYDVIAQSRGTTLGYEMYSIPSGSMSPTVQQGDKVVVDAWRYSDASPTFGDIVVCQINDVTVVKRVVGVPGDTIELRGPVLVRNSSVVEEPYLSAEPAYSVPNAGPLTLGAGEFFVLGDNRGNSNDSRYVGPLTSSAISGRVEFVAFGRSSDRFRVVLAGD